jgi:hypothetical protein
MHYVIFFGIFGLPVVVCAGMLITRLLDTAATDKLLASGHNSASGSRESEFRMRDLADTFVPVPIEPDSKQ